MAKKLPPRMVLSRGVYFHRSYTTIDGVRPKHACPYPYMDMEIGDRFFVPAATRHEQKVMYVRLARWARKLREREHIDAELEVARAAPKAAA